MATKNQHPTPNSRFSRIGFGLAPKSNTVAVRPRKKKQAGADEEWYVPYNGPYEPPREVPRKPRERDSWGDVVLEQAVIDDLALVSELPKRHAVYHNTRAGDANHVVWNGSNISGDGDKKGESRARSQSVVSRRTLSSDTTDHSHHSSIPQLRSTVSSTQRPPTTSYVNLDTSGGVGESPMPQGLAPKEGSSVHRSSRFSLGGQARRTPLESLSRKLSRPPHSGSALGIGFTAGSSTAMHRRSSSTGSSLNRDVQPKRGNTVPLDPHRSRATDDEDYYNSYYSTLINTPRRGHNSIPPERPPAASIGTGFTFPASHSQHPYARVTAKPEVRTKSEIPHLTFTDVPLPLATSVSASAAQPSASRPPTGLKTLKSSASTPNLRVATNLPLKRTKRLPYRPNGFKDRWLSAETWCDALLFPRPRLRLKQEGELGFVGSGRIVSPPGTPLPPDFVDNGIESPGKEKGMASRVLAHSRSLVNLKVSTPAAGLSSLPCGPPPVEGGLVPARDSSAIPRPPRPRSFAQDDMSLVPSVARVLQEGQLLDNERKEWQAQAKHSFQNKLSRDILRTRSKSLTLRGQRKDEPPPSNIDFLTVRACLGHQSVVPVVSSSRSQGHSSASRHRSSSRSTCSRISHSQSNSLSKTLSKSSRTHSQTHSRTDSWGKSALKMAKSAACGMTTADVVDPEIVAEAGGLESALRRDGTKVIRLADPAHIPVDKGQGVSASPVPSASSDVVVGIALSTPPSDDVLAPIRFPAHPYAQGGLYTYRGYADSHLERGSDYAGRHLSLTTGQSSVNDVSSRHRNPPQPAHPYAQVSRDSFFDDARIVPELRADSDVPPPAKMWAQWSPGIVREILPNEIQYSPFMSDKSVRSSKVTSDTTGVRAIRPQRSKDSGLRAGEGRAVVTEWEPSQLQLGAAPRRSYRKPVQYEVTRPSYVMQSQRPSDPSSGHTFASSPLMPPKPLNQQNESISEDDLPATASPATTSASSSSPRFFGNPDDLDNFHDLFYKSPRAKGKEPSDGPTSTWEGKPDRPGSGLTSLAHQLSQEFHQLAAEGDRDSYYSRASMAVSQHSTFFRRPMDSGLEFVFEESSPESPLGGISPPDASLSAFQASTTIPEDVSRSSLQADPDEDETEVYRVGVVESSSTPPATFSDHRISLSGDMSYVHEQFRHPPSSLLIPESLSQSPPNSGLHPPSSNPTRSSYLTSSSASHISGLSDFPAPPRRMSLLSSFFEEALSQSDARSSSPKPLEEQAQDQRLSFDGAEDLEDLVTALSSQASHSSHTHTYTQHS